MDGLQFSGGKDSLAVLYLLRDRLDSITVYFGDTGIVYPHMRRFVEATCRKLGARLKIVKPPVDILAFHATRGLPTDILPVEASSEMRHLMKPTNTPLLQTSISCCSAMLWGPMQNAMREDGVTTVIRGSKACDVRVGVPDGYVDECGVTYKSPIWDWTDDDVFSYLKEVGAELPEHYAEVNNSFDCLLCTAFLNHDGAAERIAYTRKHYPELWPELAKRLNLVRSIIDTERQSIDDAFKVAEV